MRSVGMLQPDGPEWMRGVPDQLKALMPPDWLKPVTANARINFYEGESLGFGVRVSKTGCSQSMPGDIPTFRGPRRVVNVHRAGWPVHSMCCRVLVTDETHSTPQVLGGFGPPAFFQARTARFKSLFRHRSSQPLQHPHPVPFLP